MKQIIHIYGASGSGTITFGKNICEALGYRFVDKGSAKKIEQKRSALIIMNGME